MPRTEESNQRIREEQRRKILLAATKVFARKGLAATKMADIAAEAGIGYGLLYHYFTNKDLIFQAAVERSTQGFQSLMTHILGLSLTPWERICQLTAEILVGMQHEPDGFLIVQNAIITDTVPQEIRDLAIRSSLQRLEELKQIIMEGQASGEVVEGDATELAALYLSCIGGIAMSFICFDYDWKLEGVPLNYLFSQTLTYIIALEIMAYMS
jgi:AcrR family transcriptional regulator